MTNTPSKTCPNCGYNPDKLTEYMKTVIPKSKIEQRIKELEPLLDESQNEKIYAELLNDPTIYYMIVKTRVEELKALLPKESINITEPNTVIQNKHIYSDENGIHMEKR